MLLQINLIIQKLCNPSLVATQDRTSDQEARVLSCAATEQPLNLFILNLHVCEPSEVHSLRHVSSFHDTGAGVKVPWTSCNLHLRRD